jgi:hypothetical protein
MHVLVDCRYQPVAELQEPYDPRKEYRSYDCMFSLPQVTRCSVFIAKGG